MSSDGVPLAALFFLDRADSNAVYPRSQVSAVASLLAQTFCTFFDREAMQYTLDFCTELGRCVPAFDLSFAPTQGVVRLVRDMDID